MEHRLCSLFVGPGMGATVLLLPYHATSLTNALVALARTALELALLSHQANVILLSSGESTLRLLVPAASLGTNGLNWTCSLSRVCPPLSLALFQVEGRKLSSLGTRLLPLSMPL